MPLQNLELRIPGALAHGCKTLGPREKPELEWSTTGLPLAYDGKLLHEPTIASDFEMFASSTNKRPSN